MTRHLLTPPALPKPPGTPIVTETTATSVTITWDSGNPDPVSYYIIQYRAKGPDSKYETVDSITTTRYSIGGLYPNTEYEIRVSAFNSIGQGPPSARVDARTGEQAPASPPRNVQAHIISQNTVMVRWEEPEEPNGQVGRGSPPPFPSMLSRDSPPPCNSLASFPFQRQKRRFDGP